MVGNRWKMTTRRKLLLGISGFVSAGIVLRSTSPAIAAADRFKLSEEAWRQRLDPDVFDVMRNKATEIPGSSALLSEVGNGVFACAACGAPLFPSHRKFDAGSGWPTFLAAVPGAVTEARIGSQREVSCSRCDGHLGYVFSDGPEPAGLRYCINGIAMRFSAGVRMSSEV